MGFFKRFKRKPGMGLIGQPVQVISGPSLHPDHFTREQNAARVSELTESVQSFEHSGDHKRHPEIYARLKAELSKHLKIKQLFYSEEGE